MRSRVVALALGLVAACVPPLAGRAAAQDRVALLIGVGDYAADDLDLRNPVNDANALRPVFERLGFDVTVVADAGIAALDAALDGFAAKLEGAEVGALFFAGHGLQIGGENYFLSASLDAATLPAIERNAVTLTRLREVFARARPESSILILDACRNTPVLGDGSAEAELRAAVGLAPTPRALPGYLIAYATDPGNVAEDGEGNNSTFTTALLQHLATPGLDIRLVFGRVRQDVVLASGGAQVPWVEESLLEGLELRPRDGESPPIVDEIALWSSLDPDDPADLKAYLAEFPDGVFKELARRRLERFAGGQSDDAPVDAASLTAAAEPARLGAALAALGHLPEAQAEVADVAALTGAAASYLRSAGLRGGAVRPAQVYAEAARATALVGASVARRIRVDMAALASVEKVWEVATTAQAELRALAADRPDAAPLLAQAAAQVAQIDEARDRILARLDQSREYYARQLNRAVRNFPEETARALGGLTRSQPEGGAEAAAPAIGDAALQADMRLFAEHVRKSSNPQTRGTIAWLADFLPG
ncbi:caspase family protein [Rubrimonas cliftonensis]|uniref:caspase family protein n=1 Tax=Rubrimonas cliftonensis TaxID=89524 RepID=UPI0015873BA7|nr:caspase family protein [Rubrimonas cliftonensis]